MLKEKFNADLKLLKKKYPYSYLTDAFLIYSFVLKKPKEWIVSNPEKNLCSAEKEEIKKLIELRIKGKPCGYIIGKKEFYGLEMSVNENVLIPRPETEGLVDEVCKDFKNKNALGLDIGTGSGCIAVALAVCGGIKTMAIDISPEAVFTARENIQKHNASIKTKLVCCDLFSALKEKRIFDFIVSNPPYLKEIPESLKYEPSVALEAAENGLYFYKKIICESGKFLKKGGALYMEFSSEQTDEIISILKKNGFKNIKIYRDIENRERGFKAYV